MFFQLNYVSLDVLFFGKNIAIANSQPSLSSKEKFEHFEVKFTSFICQKTLNCNFNLHESFSCHNFNTEVREPRLRSILKILKIIGVQKGCWSFSVAHICIANLGCLIAKPHDKLQHDVQSYNHKVGPQAM